MEVDPTRIRTAAELATALEERRRRAGPSVRKLNQNLEALGLPPSQRLKHPRVTEIRQGLFSKAGLQQVRLLLQATGITDEATLSAWEQTRERILARPDEPAPSADHAYRLGVHPCIRLGRSEWDERLTTYVYRAHDRQLSKALSDASGSGPRIVIVLGGSSTGKTRACFEAVTTDPLLSTWRLVHPAGPEHLAQLLAAPRRGGLDEPAVIWLNEAQLYLRPDHPVAEAIVRGLGQLDKRARPLVILGSLWPRYWDPLIAVTDGQPRSAMGELLITAASVISVPDHFGPAESEVLQTAVESDPRIAIAVETAGGPEALVIQTLAGGPQLASLYSKWEDSGDVRSTAAWAVLTAAIDARRIGWESPLPVSYLKNSAERYLAEVGSTEQPNDWFERATRPDREDLQRNVTAEQSVRTATRGIAPMTGIRIGKGIGPADGFLLHDYLFQHGSWHRRAKSIPREVWTLIADHDHRPEDARRLADSAFERAVWYDHPHVSSTGLEVFDRIQAQCLPARARNEAARTPVPPHPHDQYPKVRDRLKRLRDSAETITIPDNLSDVVLKSTSEADIERWTSHFVDLGDLIQLDQLAEISYWAAINVADLLSRRGDREQLALRADAGYETAKLHLAALLFDCCDKVELRRRAANGDRFAAHSLAELLAYRGEIAELTLLAIDHPNVLDRVARVLEAREYVTDDGASSTPTVHTDEVDSETPLSADLRSLAEKMGDALKFADALIYQGNIATLLDLERGRRAIFGDPVVAAYQAALGDALVAREDFPELIRASNTGARWADDRIAEVCIARNEIGALERRAAKGDLQASYRLVEYFKAKGDVANLARVAAHGHLYAGAGLYAVLAARGIAVPPANTSL